MLKNIKITTLLNKFVYYGKHEVQCMEIRYMQFCSACNIRKCSVIAHFNWDKIYFPPLLSLSLVLSKQIYSSKKLTFNYKETFLSLY